MTKLKAIFFALVMICATLAGCINDPTTPDTDGDGVDDSIDLCPSTPAGETVDADGCGQSQLDDDDDLVMNDIDICPNTPAGATVDAVGCSSSQLDDDGDGVMNNVDICPNTTAGESVDSVGCSASQLDNDGDGVMNDVDLCPDTDTGATVDVDGCADNQLDTDGDGVTNDIDACPDTDAGAIVDADGCATNQLDSDGDGVMDDVDACPDTPAGETVDSDGCPIVFASSEYTNISFIRAVDDDLFYFAYDINDDTWKLMKYNVIDGIVVIKSLGQGQYKSANTCNFASIGNTFFFGSHDDINGYELWKSDGTASGTVLVKDINSGSGASYPWHCTPIDTDGDGEDDTIYFRADDGIHGTELWMSDGTTSGTVMVKDINSGGGSLPVSITHFLTSVDNTLFFRANDGVHGDELWKSDGTAAGTVMVKDIRSGSFGSYIVELTTVGNILFFRADDGVHGDELWKSDGTTAGTVMVKDIDTGLDNSYPRELTAIDTDGDGESDALYFKAHVQEDGEELWMSDGTSAGTVMVKDIYSGNQGGNPTELTLVDNTLYFKAHDGTNGYELWKSDGTAAGTVMVKDINSGGNSYAGSFTACSALYFIADDGDGYELWKSDGTTAGTVMVEDIHTAGGTISIYGSNMMCLGSTLFFVVIDNSNFEYLWKTDGTAAGTVMV